MPPIRFSFGIHLHQPVGNFDSVFEQHMEDVYLPFLRAVVDRGFLPIAVHISGPLIEWLEGHRPDYLDLVGRLAADGRIELLLAGFYEPVLASLPREDRIEQIRWMRGALGDRFGVDARGLWLTERVWEPDLAADLHDAGVRYALVDDRHFLVSGFRREQLHAPFWTESGGKRVALFPIDERLRYLVPFQPPHDTVGYLRWLRESGHQLAVLADDGEKFGGWPGTKEWVYDRGWLASFLGAMQALVESGEVVLSTLADALESVPSGGLAYLPTASYREMEGWSLPPEQGVRLAHLERDLGHDRVNGPDGALVRGSHWRNFLVKYPESNRMHKKMVALSELCRREGDPAVARRAIGRAQCNDAYWHGVFGGLYLPHLRDAVWHQLAIAEGALRRGQPLGVDVLDIDCDGHDEVWVHSSAFSAIVSPHRGGVIEEYTRFADGVNHANALTRRRESYHHLAAGDAHGGAPGDGEGAPSIHELEEGIRLDELPPADLDTRALFVDRVLQSGQPFDRYARADYTPLWSWAAVSLAFHIERSSVSVEVVMAARDVGREMGGGFEKRISFRSDGGFTVSYRWDPSRFEEGSSFAPELSLARPVDLECEPAAELWRYPIETVAKSERGLDRTVQGEAVTIRWPASLGAAVARVGAVGSGQTTPA